MPTIKLASSKSTIVTSGITSSNVSSSLSGNMSLIKSQIKEKTNDYINIKNATRILEKFSNYNGYIKIYTEVQSNIDENDIVYITCVESSIDSETLNLANPTIPDEGADRFYLGYKVLYVNSYKNEIVINKYYNDIDINKKIKNQYISKVSCKNGDLYDNVSDGVIFYECNVLNGNFGTLTGIVSGSIISGATLLCAGIKTISDSYGNYSIAIPVGHNIVKCSAYGYITKTFDINILKNQKLNYNILMTAGINSITITGRTMKCEYETLILSALTVGYDDPVKYQWKINRGGYVFNIGTDNYQIAYMLFEDNDIVTCEVTDEITKSVSNDLIINVVPKQVTISSSTHIIYYGQYIEFTVSAICYMNPTYQWKINNLVKSTSNIFLTNELKNNDVVTCIVNGDVSNSIIVQVSYWSLYLGYSLYNDESACISSTSIYYTDNNVFLNSNRLYKFSTGANYADSGYYSDGLYSRYWDKSQLKFNNDYAICSNYTTTTTTI